MINKIKDPDAFYKKEILKDQYKIPGFKYAEDKFKLAKNIMNSKGSERRYQHRKAHVWKSKDIKLASDLLSYGGKYGNIEYALTGAKLLDHVKEGLGNRPSVKNRLKKSIENMYNEKQEKYVKETEEFLKNHPKEDEMKSPLEKILTTVGIFSILGSLFLLSPNLTGNAILSTSKGFSNPFGVILFVLGLGMIISAEKKIYD